MASRRKVRRGRDIDPRICRFREDFANAEVESRGAVGTPRPTFQFGSGFAGLRTPRTAPYYPRVA